MLERLRSTLRGARQIEIFVLIILIALAGLCLMDRKSSNTDNGADTALEARLESILACIDGVDSPEVMITESDIGGVNGVVVVARGIENMQARLNVQNAVQTLLNIELSRIEIIDRK